MKVPVFISGKVIDELIRATGFNQIAEPTYDIEYKCKWLLERIGIQRLEATRGSILHDNPETSQLVALVEYERRTSAALRHTIETQRLEADEMRRQLKKNLDL